jgi:glc operon protein GlcG
MPTRHLASASILVSLVVGPAVLAASAQLTATAASQILDGCAAHAKAKGQSHAIAVYDDGGNPVALLRMDGNASGIAAFAMQKAEAVARWRFSTADMANAAKETPGFGDAPHIVTVPGGVPVFSTDGQSFLGAVGVSGEAPADDAACAEAGVKAAGLSSVRKRAS